jgi:hypothetical protein
MIPRERSDEIIAAIQASMEEKWKAVESRGQNERRQTTLA